MRALPIALVLMLAACGAPAQVHEFSFTLSNLSLPGDLVDRAGGRHDIAFAPAILVVHDADFRLFDVGQATTRAGFEAMTEDGNNVDLVYGLDQAPGVLQVVSFAPVDADYQSQPLGPGASVTESVLGGPEDRLTLVSMFGQSNDVFVATPPEGLALFQGRDPILGEWAGALGLFDGGTEVNQEPGLGADQPPRQQGRNQGADEGSVVRAIDGQDAAGFAYPAPVGVLSLQVTALPALTDAP